MSLSDVYTERQIEVLKKYKQGFRLMINYGAKRSGKTVIDNDLFLMELREVRKRADKKNIREPLYILAGVSSKTIEQNVLNPIRNKYGIDFQFDKHGNFTLFGVKVVLAYTGSIGGLGAIRGMTSFGSYINEASMANMEVFKEIMDRCSEKGSKIICDTNPDNPEHWLKKNYLDNDNPNFKIVSTHFTLEDNTFLDSDYIEQQKAGTPSGMFYDRDILGLWVNSEGAVYQDFDKNKMIVDEVPDDLTYIAGVDWGYSHFGSIVVFGKDNKNNYYLVEEHTKQYKEIDYWTETAQKIRRKYKMDMPFYCDTARVEHINHFVNAEINARYGYKSVINGIEIISKLMKQGNFYVKDGVTDRFLKEIYSYAWNDKSRDQDAVIKENDDVMDAMRYCLATPIHLDQQRKYYPTPDRNKISQGLRKMGL